ncbi:MAG: hypothetical protein R3C49_24415 [Planctomycetaceae bacterium]
MRQGVAWAHSLGGRAWIVDDGRIFEDHGLHLDMQHSQITDDDLRTITVLADVHRINLDGTAVTNIGLEHLAHCRGLKYVDVFETPGHSARRGSSGPIDGIAAADPAA